MTPTYRIEAKFADTPNKPFDAVATFTTKTRKPLAEWITKFNEVNGVTITAAKVIRQVNSEVVEEI